MQFRRNLSHNRTLRSHSWLKSFFKRRTHKPHAFVLRKDYMNKTFINPYYQKSLMPRRTKAKKTKMGIAAAALAGIVCIGLFHPYFDVTSVEITGSKSIPSASLEHAVRAALAGTNFFIFKKNNFFLLNKSSIERALSSQYAFDTVRIRVMPFHRLVIAVTEKQTSLVVKNGASYYLLDSDGKIIGPADPQESASTDFATRTPQLWLAKETALAAGQSVIDAATMQFVLTVFKNVPDRIGILLQGATLEDQEGRIVSFTTSEGWQVLMDRQNDWEQQITTLKNILAIKFKDNNRSALHYIDVRYENRVYIK